MSNASADEKRAAVAKRREQTMANRSMRRVAGSGTDMSAEQSGSGDYSGALTVGSAAASASVASPTSYGRRPQQQQQPTSPTSQKNLGTKPLLDTVYSTSLRTLGHSLDGKVIFTTSNLPAMSLTSLRPIAQLGTQLQRIVVDNNALETLEDLRGCVSLVHLSAAGNQLEHDKVFPFLVASSNTLNYLNLNDNRIASLQGLEKLRFLVTVMLDGNQLTSLEVEGMDDAQMQAAANESCNAHCAALLDDVIKAIDETNSKGKPRSRRNSMHESAAGMAVLAREHSGGGLTGAVANSGSGSSSAAVFGTDKSTLSRGATFSKQRSVHIKGIAHAKDADDDAANAGPCTSPLRFLVSLWRFSAANNDIKEIRPAVFERCPLRLLNLSNNQLCDLDFVLPLHRTLMVLTLDGNNIAHLPASTVQGSSGGGGIRRLGSRHLGDAVHASKAVHHAEVAHLNFQMMRTLVSLNLARNNIASFNEISELRHLPQLRHLTLAQCTLCSLPTAADLSVREEGLRKRRPDGVRSDHDLGCSTLDATALTAERIAAAAAKAGGGVGGGIGSRAQSGHESDFQSGVFGPRTDTIQLGGGGGSRHNSRKPSAVMIQSPSMADYGSSGRDFSSDATGTGGAGAAASGSGQGSGALTASATFTVEALIRPDDAEAVTFRTPEEQDAAEFNKRTTDERYRLKVLMHVPQLQTLDGVPASTEDIAEAQQLAGGYLREERTRAIAKYIKPAGGSAGAALRKLISARQ